MVIELLKKDRFGVLDDMVVSVAKESITFSGDIRIKFQKYWGCEVYIDKDEDIVVFKPGNIKSKGFRFKTNKRATIKIPFRLKHLNKRKYKAEFKYFTKFKEEVVVIKVKNLKEILRKRGEKKSV